MKKLLVLTDFTELSDFALQLAIKIAKRTDADLHALHIINVPGDAVFNKEGELHGSNDFNIESYQSEKRFAERNIQKWLAQYEAPGKATVMYGQVVDTSIKYVEDEEIDMIVMGTREIHGLKEMITGSTAERLVRSAPVPVLSLKCDRSGMEIKDILLACDFGEAQEEDLSAVKMLQKAFDAKIHLLRVNTPRQFVSTREMLDQMQAYAKLNELENITYHGYCDHSVEEGIHNFCVDHDIDFIAMGNHGRKGLSHLLKKSISEDMVNHVFQPILTYRAH